MLKLNRLSQFVREDQIKQDNKAPEEKMREAEKEKKRQEAIALRKSQRLQTEDDDDDDDDEEEESKVRPSDRTTMTVHFNVF
jgi:hypothetical protein